MREAPDGIEPITIKRITAENWLKPDPMHRYFGMSDATASFDPLERGRLDVVELAGIAIDDRLPVDVRKMFYTTMGVIAYGWFLYQLYAVAVDRFFMCAELAIRVRYEALNKTPLKRPSFHDRIIWLCENNQISRKICGELQMWRDGRNSVLHPSYQGVLMYIDAKRASFYCAKLLNAIFLEQPGPRSADDPSHDHRSPLDPVST